MVRRTLLASSAMVMAYATALDARAAEPPVAPAALSTTSPAATPLGGTAAAPTKTEPYALNEVVVTATRRETKLEQTPVAITAISGTAVDQQRLYNLSNVAEKTPGLVFTPLSRQESYLSIRGTTAGNDAAGANLGVSVFIDDVPTTGIGDNNPDLFDLQSIEVLRGPQGTLFGQNVTGGAVVINTLKPSFTPHESVQATYGNYNLGEIRAYVTGPITDTLAGKLTVEGRRQDGYLNNVDLHDHALSTDDVAVRSQLLWTPTSKLHVLLGVDYNDDFSPYKAQQLVGNFQPSLFPPLSYSPTDTNQGINSKGNSQTGGALVRIDYDTPYGALTSISGYRYVHDTAFFSTSAEPDNELLQHVANKDYQISEEIRLASPSTQRLTYVVGLFYLDSHRENNKGYNLNIIPGTAVSFAQPYSALDFNSTDDQTIFFHSYAVFGEANYAITHKLKLTVGGRYTDEDKEGHDEVTDTSGLSPVLVTPQYGHRWTGFTPKVTLDYQATPQILTYATYATGFKSGGYDTSGTSIQGLETPFKPETVDSYEVGYKVTALQNRLTVNGDFYYADYTNLQVQQYDQALLQFITANAGRAKIPGAEIEAEYDPLRWLSFNGSYTYIHSNYTTYSDQSGDNFSGNQIPFSARTHANVGAEIHFVSPHLANGEVRLGGDVTYQSRKFFTDQNSEPPFIVNKTPENGILNLEASWTSPDKSVEILLWGKNVTDQRSLIYATNLTPFYANIPEYVSGQDSMFVTNWTPPAMFGITLTYKR